MRKKQTFTLKWQMIAQPCSIWGSFKYVMRFAWQQCLVHDQLLGTTCQGHSRQVRDHWGSHDHRARLHGHPENGRWALGQGLAWWTYCRHQHHTVFDWCCQSCRQGHPGAQLGVPCASSRRVCRWSDLSSCQRSESLSYRTMPNEAWILRVFLQLMVIRQAFYLL